MRSASQLKRASALLAVAVLGVVLVPVGGAAAQSLAPGLEVTSSLTSIGNNTAIDYEATVVVPDGSHVYDAIFYDTIPDGFVGATDPLTVTCSPGECPELTVLHAAYPVDGSQRLGFYVAEIGPVDGDQTFNVKYTLTTGDGIGVSGTELVPGQPLDDTAVFGSFVDSFVLEQAPDLLALPPFDAETTVTNEVTYDRPVLTLEKSAVAVSPVQDLVPGAGLEYQIVVTNEGSVDAVSVMLSDTSDQGWVVQADSVVPVDVVFVDGEFTVPVIQAGQAVTFSYVTQLADAVPADSVTNTATLTQFADPNEALYTPVEVSSTVTVDLEFPVLEIEKSNSASPYFTAAGTVIPFTIVVSNSSASTAYEPSVVDELVPLALNAESTTQNLLCDADGWTIVEDGASTTLSSTTPIAGGAEVTCTYDIVFDVEQADIVDAQNSATLTWTNAFDGANHYDTSAESTIDYQATGRSLFSLVTPLPLPLPTVSGVISDPDGGVDAVMVTLTPDGGGDPVTEVTAGGGLYSFADLVDGDYQVDVDTVATILEGLDGEVSALVTVAGGSQMADFAFTAAISALLAPGPGMSAIGDFVSGLVSDPTGGVDAITVTLTPPVDIDLGAGLGVPITTTTAGGGLYSFADVADGDHQIGVDTTGTVLEGLVGEVSAPVTVAGGSQTADFAFTYPPLDCSITADNAVFINATGNSASVADAGPGATYAWTVTGSGTVVSGDGTNTITWDAGAAGTATIAVTITDQYSQICTELVDVNVAALVAMSIDVQTITPLVNSGNQAQIRVTFACLSTLVPCEGMAVDFEHAPESGGGIPFDWRLRTANMICTPNVTSFDFGGFVVETPLAAGVTGECLLTYTTAGGYVPDGTELNLEATLTADNGATLVDDDSVFIRSEAVLRLDKRLSIDPAQTGNVDPPLDSPFTYDIALGTDGTPFSPESGGAWWIDRYTITDTLPVGAELVDVVIPNDADLSNTVVEITGTPATGIVVTATSDYTGEQPPNRTGFLFNYMTLTVIYPSAVFGITESVTNTADVIGYPVDLPEVSGNELTATDSVTHQFTQGAIGGSFGKGHNQRFPWSADDVQPGEELIWTIGGNNLQTNIPTRLEVTDTVVPDAPYSPYFRTTRIGISVLAGTEYEFYYTTNLNGTEQLVTGTTPPPRGRLNIPVGPGETIDVDNVTEWITGYRFVLPNLAPGAAYSFAIQGYYDESIDPVIRAAAPVDLRVESENCAIAIQTSLDVPPSLTLDYGPSCDDIWVKVETPFVSARKGMRPGSPTLLQPGETTGFGLMLNASLDPDTGGPLNPVVLDLLPPELTYVAGSVTYPQPWKDATGMPEPVFEVIDNFEGTGRQALRWTWPNGEEIPPGAFTNINTARAQFVLFDVLVAPGTQVGPLTNTFWAGDSSGDLDLAYCNGQNPDDFDVDGDGDRTEPSCERSWSINIAAAAAMEATKSVRGDQDADFLITPDIGSASPDPGGSFEYKIEFANTGNIPITDLVMYDILPFVGDTGVSEALNVPRGSEWTPELVAPVSIDLAPHAVAVAYSTSSNPCRDGVFPDANNAGCVDDWTTTPPVDLSTVRALRFDFGPSVVQPNEGFVFTIPFTVPLQAPSGDFVEISQTAWNSIAYTGTRDGCNVACELPVVEPVKVGVQIPPASVSGVISFDGDGDGAQDPTEGLSGVVVDLVCVDVYGRTVEYMTTTSDGTTDVDGDGVIDPIGSYYFGDLLPGDCTLTVDEATLPTDAEGNTLDPDDVLDSTTEITVETGESYPDQDFGYSGASIGVEKATNGQDADVVTGPGVGVGEAVTWTYVMTNDGTSHLADVTVTDDQLVIDYTTCVFADGRAGDFDADDDIDILLIGESVTCEANGTAGAGQYENTATVTGTPTYVEPDPQTGEPLVDVDGYATPTTAVPSVDPPQDQDLSHYFGIAGSIGDTVWLDNNGDGVEDGGAEIGLAGATVTLTPPVDVDLGAGLGVAITTITDADGMYLFSGLPPGAFTVSVDVSTVTNLAAGVTVAELVQTYDADGVGTPDASDVTIASGENNLLQDFGYEPRGSISGVVELDEDGDRSGDSTMAGVFLELFIDADGDGQPDGQAIADVTTGADGTFLFEGLLPGDYVVVQTQPPGHVSLDDFDTSPDGDPFDADRTVDNQIAVSLGVGEQDETNDFLEFVPEPGIDVEKATLGYDADTIAESVPVRTGAEVVWTYEITNTGNVALTDLGPVDDRGVALDCAGSPTIALLVPGQTISCFGTGAAPLGQYTNIVDVEGTPAFPTNVGPDFVPNDPGTYPTDSDAYTPVLNEQGEPLEPVADSDPSNMFGVLPAVSVEKSTNGEDADVGPGPSIGVGGAVTWVYVVTNDGNVALADVVVSDDQGVVVDCGDGSNVIALLLAGETASCIGSGSASAGQYANVGDVVGTPVFPCADCRPDNFDPADVGTYPTDPADYEPIVDPTTEAPLPDVSADDPSHYFGAFGPGLVLVKQVCGAQSCLVGDDVGWVETTEVPKGTTVAWRLSVTNTGDIGLVDVEIEDAVSAACERVIDVLGVGETVHIVCDSDPLSADTVNTAVATGVPGDSDGNPIEGADPVTSFDDAAATVVEQQLLVQFVDPVADVALVKSVDAAQVALGEQVTWTIEVTNQGPIPITELEVTDNLPAGVEYVSDTSSGGYDVSTGLWDIGDLGIGKSVLVNIVTVASAEGTHRNVGEVTAMYQQDVDSTPNNHVMSEDDQDDAKITVIARTKPLIPLALTGNDITKSLAAAATLITAGSALLITTRRRRRHDK